MEEKKEKIKNEDLKKILEKTAFESGVKVKGEIAVLKSDEQREAEKDIQEWKESKTTFHYFKEFLTAHELLKCLFSTAQYSGFLMLGEGGLGKTILTLNCVKDNFKTDEWEYSNGYTTPLSLFEFLYLNRNKKVIILDDVEGIFNNALALSILKGALWESDGKRICQYSSKSDKAKMPEKFVINAKIIILCNHIPKENDVSTRATLSRVLNYKIALSFDEKIRICKSFLEREKLTDSQLKKINYILDNKVSEATKDFNFRTLRKLIAFVKYDECKAEKLFEATTEIDEFRFAYLRVSKINFDSVKEQIKAFIEETGSSRSMFFRIKKSFKVSRKKDVKLK